MGCTRFQCWNCACPNDRNQNIKVERLHLGLGSLVLSANTLVDDRLVDCLPVLRSSLHFHPLLAETIFIACCNRLQHHQLLRLILLLRARYVYVAAPGVQQQGSDLTDPCINNSESFSHCPRRLRIFNKLVTTSQRLMHESGSPCQSTCTSVFSQDCNTLSDRTAADALLKRYPGQPLR